MRQSFTGMLAIAALAAATGAALGCDGGADDGSGSTGTGGQSSTTTSSTGGGGGGQGGAGGGAGAGTAKIDLLFVIDNSRSMADKQQILAQSVPELVERLVNPLCIGAGGAVQVEGPFEPCPAGYQRAFEPVLDMHVGIISSSLGGHGADACQATSAQTQSNNDRGHLLARSSADQDNNLVPSTYDSKRFLAWDPAQRLSPPGEADLDGDSAADANTTALAPLLAEMVVGVGQVGCGYESQQEAWYRFLADPEPYQSIEVTNGQATPMGIDDVLLQQRADFLRPSSVLAVVLLSDENDCSIRESGQYYLAAQQVAANSAYHLYRPRAECAVDPDDPCCLSCGQSPGNCPMDPTCYVNGDPAQGPAPLTGIEDHPSLRCFDQKRRFGIDFLYPIDRYVDALTQPTVANRAGELVPNPIFSDLDPGDADSAVRPPSRVFLAGLVGVPWQDLSRDPADLASGYKSAAELMQPVVPSANAWQLLLGEPGGPPVSPFMIESIAPRAGVDPITGVAISPPGGAPNPINGTEYATQQSDLQYACIFALPPGAERDCSVPGAPSCDCAQPGSDNPLCDANDPSVQVRAKAYPGIRHLQVLRDLGEQAVVTSLCPAQVTDDTGADYGYRPAMSAIVDAIAPQL